MFLYAWRILALTAALAAATTIWSAVDVDPPGDEADFVAGDTLTEDGRVGKVTDVQGIVSVRPVMARRWTPVAGPVILKPGDWLRTDRRGANAVALRLTGGARITLGPGTLMEIAAAWKRRGVLVACEVGGWSSRMAGTRVDDRHAEVVSRAHDAVEALDLVEEGFRKKEESA